MRLAIKQETAAFDARLQAIVAAARQDLDLPDGVSLNMGTMSWEYDETPAAGGGDGAVSRNGEREDGPPGTWEAPLQLDQLDRLP
jgi:hypothetical protein